MNLVFLSVCVLLSIVMSQIRPSWMEMETHWILITFMCACLVPAWRWSISKRREAIPFAPAVGLFYFLWFGYAAYADSDLYATVAVSDLTTETAIAVFGAVVASALGWRLALIGRKQSGSLEKPGPNNSRLSVESTSSHGVKSGIAKIGISALGFLVILRLTDSLSFFPGSIQQLVIYVETFTRALAAYALATRSRESWFFIALGVLGFDLLLALNTGSLYHVVTRVMLIGIVFTSVSRSLRPLIALVVVGTLVFVSLQTVKFYFRAQVWDSESSLENVSELDKLQIWQEGIERKFSAENSSEGELLDSASARASAIALFEHVRRLCPAVVPFREGETLIGGLVGIIPRALWPDKPKSSFGHEFGHEFAIIGPLDRTTAINVSWLADWYWNFGDLGVIFGMFLTGLLLGFIDRVYNAVTMSPFDLAVGLSLIWPQLIIQESNWAMSFSGLPLMILFYLVLRRWYMRPTENAASKTDRPQRRQRPLRAIGS